MTDKTIQLLEKHKFQVTDSIFKEAYTQAIGDAIDVVKATHPTTSLAAPDAVVKALEGSISVMVGAEECLSKIGGHSSIQQVRAEQLRMQISKAKQALSAKPINLMGDSLVLQPSPTNNLEAIRENNGDDFPLLEIFAKYLKEFEGCTKLCHTHYYSDAENLVKKAREYYATSPRSAYTREELLEMLEKATFAEGLGYDGFLSPEMAITALIASGALQVRE